MIDELREILLEIEARTGLTPEQALVSLRKSQAYIPLNAFSARLGILEAAVKYLHENRGMRFCEISRTIGRDQRTVWASYANAVRKMPRPIGEPHGIMVPAEILRKGAPLQALVEYCRDTLNMRYCRIAHIIRRDARVIWASANR